MTTAQRSQHRQDHNLLGNMLVKPGHMEKLSLGMYEQGMPEPALRLEYEPNVPDVIGASLERIDEGDHYRLVYHVQNFGDRACRVRVHLVQAVQQQVRPAC